MNRTPPTIDDLPELPFEQVLSYLSLQDRLRLSTISRSCHQKIANIRVKSLCYSERPLGCILGKNQLVSGTFARNFIYSFKFTSFFDAFGGTVLSNLRHLRLCDVDLDGTAFNRTLNSFGQLEELDIIRPLCSPQRQFKLNLPMLTSIHLEELTVNKKLTLEAPRLRSIKLLDCSVPRLDIVHGESVESFITNSSLESATVKNLSNLKYLYAVNLQGVDSTFLSSLQQLKEVHLAIAEQVSKLFRQKRRYDRTDMKIYLRGLLLNGPDDPLREALLWDSIRLERQHVFELAKNPSRLASEVPFYRDIENFEIQHIAPGLEVDGLLKRLTHLNQIRVERGLCCNTRFAGVRSFLDLLKNFENVVKLSFYQRSQELLDWVPEHVQQLIIGGALSDWEPLFRLKHLVHLQVCQSVDVAVIRKAFEELPYLSSFTFTKINSSPYPLHRVTIAIGRRKRIMVWVGEKFSDFAHLNAAFRFIFETNNKKPKKPSAVFKRSD